MREQNPCHKRHGGKFQRGWTGKPEPRRALLKNEKVESWKSQQCEARRYASPQIGALARLSLRRVAAQFLLDWFSGIRELQTQLRRSTRMDHSRLSHYAEKLRKRKGQILAALRHLERENQELTGKKHVDWIDQAADENELRLLDRLNEGYLTELGRIEMAQRRVSSGTYGLCLGCHRAIETARLEASPETEFCLECQDLRERFERAV
jgi:DnaK suppressor protein